MLAASACLREELVPGVHVTVGGAIHLRAHAGMEAARIDARGECPDLSCGEVEAMREKHRGGVAAPDLERVDEEAAFERRDVDEEPGGAISCSMRSDSYEQNSTGCVAHAALSPFSWSLKKSR